MVRARFRAVWAVSRWSKDTLVGLCLWVLLNEWNSVVSLARVALCSCLRREVVWMIFPLVTTLWAAHKVSEVMESLSFNWKCS